MLQFVRILILVVVALALIMLAVANRDPVTVQMMPAGLDGIWQMRVTIPLFVLMILLVGGGFTLGYSWEWLREWKHRRTGQQHAREAARLKREVESLRETRGEPSDDIVALLKN